MTVVQLKAKHIALYNQIEDDPMCRTPLKNATRYILHTIERLPKKASLLHQFKGDILIYPSREWVYVIYSAIYDLEH